MNIYEKLQTMRVELQALNIKKSGENKFAGYKYYELADIMPPINEIMLNHKVTSFITFETESAVLTMVNCEAPEEMIQFTSPMKGASLKGAHDIQNLGAVETYQRRYLYMAAFEIVENDALDASQGKDQKQPQNGRKATERVAKAQKSLLSDETSRELNAALKKCAGVCGVKVGAIVERLEREILRKQIGMVADEDAERVLHALEKWEFEAISGIQEEE